MARPAVATERLSKLVDGRILYRLRHPWRDGTSHVIFDPLDLVGKLAALVPPPRFNLVRYHGVLAPSARWRLSIVPAATSDGDVGCKSHMGRKRAQDKADQVQPAVHPRNYAWAELLRRVFGFKVLRCDSCGSRMRILCAVNPPRR